MTREISFRENEMVNPQDFVEALATSNGLEAKYSKEGNDYKILIINGNGRPSQVAFSIRSGYDEKTQSSVFHLYDGAVQISDETIQKVRRSIALRLEDRSLA